MPLSERRGEMTPHRPHTLASRQQRVHGLLVAFLALLLAVHTSPVRAQQEPPQPPATVACPQDTIFFCNNPVLANELWDVDPNVSCDPETCAWRTEGFLPDQSPFHCRDLAFEGFSVTDWLEPCLLWELVYGEFMPTASPTVSAPPSALPSVAPSSLPTLAPTTSAPSSMPSLAPTGAPFVATEAPTVVQDIGETDGPQTEGKFDAILLTFFLPPAQQRRRSLYRPALRALSSSSLSIEGRGELYYLTEDHLERTIPNLERLRLVLTPYQEVTVTRKDDGPKVVAVTEMLQGTLYMTQPTDLLASPESIANVLRQAFVGDALVQYVRSLQSSSDPVLRRVDDVAFGIPDGVPDLVNGNGIDGNGISVDDDDDEDDSLGMIWIVVAVCGSLGLLGLLVVGCAVCSRHPDGVRGVLGDLVKPNNTGLSSPTSSMEPQLIRRMQSTEAPSPPLYDRTSKSQNYEGDLDAYDNLPSGSNQFNDIQSDITSVYSYIDKNGLNNESFATDDQYSMGPSLLQTESTDTRGNAVPHPEENKKDTSSSGMWSIMDGLGLFDSLMPPPTTQAAATSSSTNNNPPVVNADIPAQAPSADDNDIYIFNDDDDGAASLGSGTSGMAPANGDDSSHVVLHTDTSPIRNDSFRSDVALERVDPDTQLLAVALSSPAKSTTDGSTAAATVTASMPEILASKANNNLSQVLEVSENTSRSRTSTDGPSSATSSSAAVLAKSMGSLVDDSKNESNEKDNDDDDDSSSLFMGPDSVLKENQSTNPKSLLTLNENHKVTTTDAQDSYRISPLARSGLPKDKKAAAGGGSITPVSSRDDSLLGEALLYPSSYAIADFRDDMSISTSGSRRYSGSTLASF